ncbi:hypothetical protein C0W66_05240 [Photobacterium kishitanii]|nr:hypothetical protein C0W66_05240 [Photobacterium kishitanii]
MRLINASTRLSIFSILDFFGVVSLSDKFRLNLHSKKRVIQVLPLLFLIPTSRNRANNLTNLCSQMS